MAYKINNCAWFRYLGFSWHFVFVMRL